MKQAPSSLLQAITSGLDMSREDEDTRHRYGGEDTAAHSLKGFP